MITPMQIETAMAVAIDGGVHHVLPEAVSITQATEWGTVYAVDEVGAIGEACRRRGLALHMDGARFANALIHADCTPAELTWKAGDDVLSFGATKNGALAAEAVPSAPRACGGRGENGAAGSCGAGYMAAGYPLPGCEKPKGDGDGANSRDFRSGMPATRLLIGLPRIRSSAG